ncbi:putative aldouronate transport system substrate-binding protein [Paenibacillus sp. CF095]|uniref:extracellular solute-binding protein n=1 Tax=Paenibacillus sp. CF095 TaxID=1881033 RepID=UPI00088A4DE6|nr:extracellular solute-binding protein [Paenibacillus sp. CF095]SDD53874.1 putative aldouronate transport system substrate-binding protein [Paenibacillus sp. CF095]
MKKRVLATALAATLLTTGLLGCSNNNSQDSTASEKGNTETKVLNIVNGKIEPTATFSTIRLDNPALKFRDGESITDNVFTRWTEKSLGVKIKTLWTGGATDGSFTTKLKLMLSSGDEMPDVINLNDFTSINMLIDSGKFMDVGEAFEKYASPIYKEAMAAKEDAWLPFIRDGKKMALPTTDADFGQAQSVVWFRQDWLDKLKLKAPTTIEELENVMDAFVNQDPDGNGVKDTFALDFSMKDRMAGAPIGDATWIFGLFGAVPERWYPGEDGTLQYGSIQPGIKQGLAKLTEWKTKGYVASDIALHDTNSIVQTVASDKVGIVCAPSFFWGYPGALLLANNPKALYVPYPMPEGVNGQNMRTNMNLMSAILINKDISDESLQAFFHYMNSMYSVFESDDPFYFKGYQEGYDYVIKDGKIITDDKEIPGGKINTIEYVFGSALMHSTKIKELFDKISSRIELTEQEKALAIITGTQDDSTPSARSGFDAYLVSNKQASANVRQYYVGPMTSTMSARNELLQKMQMEAFTKIIYGQAPVDSFDQFVEKWKSSGGDTITKEVNEWYESVK